MPPEPSSSIAVPAGLAELTSRYRLLLCDIWGVVHDGRRAFSATADALTRFRDGGGRVILVSNAPRPCEPVIEQLDQLGVPRHTYDAVVTSGDVTRGAIAARSSEGIYRIGPDRDLSLFHGLSPRFVGEDEADYVVCTGLFDDETETVASYEGTLRRARERGLVMVCANPDIVVERGSELVLCAGALAEAYAGMGGEVVMAGKPHRPIYDAAMDQGAALLDFAPRRDATLAVGDALRTDIAGAAAYGIDSLLVARGIHAAELGAAHDGSWDRDRALAWLAGREPRPTYVIDALRW
ncbi:MAG: TIGR01459 family HAD-type hydrolase [Methylobacteriaceae bacterium]|nr:TIGR01459 family HAD-type hydrolase [Methylobacteriaceae bacterium]